MNKYIIYTDGACKGNFAIQDEKPRRGGGAAIICNDNNQIINQLYGGFIKTTSPRMEIRGVLEGLRAISDPSEITVISDSQYVVNTINDNGLQKVLNNPDSFSNIDLGTKLAQLLEYHKVTMIGTKGHADNEMNNKADKLAQFAANLLNLPEDEYTYNGEENREPLVSEPTTGGSNRSNTGQKNGEVMYSLG